MAGEGVVGVLKAVLGLDTAQFEDGAKKAANSMAGFGTQMKAVFAGVGLERIVERVFDAIAHKFKEVIVHAFEFADQMGKMAQKVGVSVEELTGLKLAADLADVNIETLSKSLGILSKNMVAAASGNKELADKFNQLGISVRDGEGDIKSVTEVLAQIADKFEGTKDGAVKVEAALKLLGRGGKELIPLLNEGGKSLREFAETAQRMGLVISTDTFTRIQKFNDELKLIGKVSEGVANEVVRQIIPALGQMSSELAKTAKSGDLIKASADIIVAGFKEVLVWAIVLTEGLRIIGEGSKKTSDDLAASGRAVNIFKSDLVTVDIEKGSLLDYLRRLGTTLPDTKRELGEAGASAKDAKKDLSGIFVVDTDNLLAKALGLTNEQIAKFNQLGTMARKIAEAMLAPVPVQAKKAGDSIDDPLNKNMEKLNDHIRGLHAQALDTSGAFSGQLAPGFLAATAGMEALKGQITNVHDKMILLGPDAERFNLAMLEVAGAKLTQEFLDPFTLLEQKLAAINLLLKEKKINHETAAAAGQKAAADTAIAYGQAALNIVGPFATAFKDLAAMNKKYAGAAKALAIGEALVQTFLGAVKAYTATVSVLGPIGATAAAAAATAAGLANVAKISATQFAQGGSFKVGGVGGIDSQTIAMNLTPGEMVDVRKPGQTTTTQEITINMRGRDIFSGDAIRDLFTAINQGTSDGYRLKLAET